MQNARLLREAEVAVAREGGLAPLQPRAQRRRVARGKRGRKLGVLGDLRLKTRNMTLL